MLDLLAGLTRKSLVVAEEQADGTVRYRLLETVREYAAQRLAARGPAEMAAARGRHAVFYSALAGQLGPVEQASPSHASGDAPIEVVRDRIEAAYDNVRAALGWWLGEGRPVEGLTLADALGFFWHVHGLYAEGRRWLEDLLEHADRPVNRVTPPAAALPSVPPALRANALSWLGLMAGMQGDYARARAAYEASVAIWRELADQVMLADDLGLVSVYRWLTDDAAGSIGAVEESLRLCRANGIRGEAATTLRNLGVITRWQGQYARAVAFLRESVAEARAQPVGAYHRAYNVARSAAQLGRTAYLQGDAALARAAFREALDMISEARLADHTLADFLDWLAALDGAFGQPTRAAKLLGAADARWRPSGAVRFTPDRPVYERDVAALRAVLHEQAFVDAWVEGQALGWEQAVALAKSVLASEPAWPAPSPDVPEANGLLTARQREVAVLVARGLTNRQIAEQLTITERAAGAHIERILNRLDVRSRAQIAVWVAEQGLLGSRTTGSGRSPTPARST